MSGIFTLLLWFLGFAELVTSHKNGTAAQNFKPDDEDTPPPDEVPEDSDPDPHSPDDQPTDQGDGQEPHDQEMPNDQGGGDDPHDHDTPTDHGDGHDPHDQDMPETPLPTTPEEIEAFVAAVRAAEELHVHDMGSPKAAEHMAALTLVPRDEATHIAIGNGSWFDPDNWYQGQIPEDDARVLIPEGVHITYDDTSDARLFTVRVDGHLDFATDTDSRMVLDTMIVTPGANLTIGTQETPVEPNVDVDIIFANNGPIDVSWDPMLLSRGLIAHGEVNIHGARKDSHEKVIEDPDEGDTWIEFAATPEGWEVGDTIVIAGTRYDGYKWDDALQDVRHYAPEDEVRVIAQIDGGRVYFDAPLEHEHDTPQDDLKTSVANYTRNISFSTENPDEAEIYERGHVMFMHSDDVDVRYAEFHELGRTDKSEPARNVSELEDVAFDSNVKGRYPAHFHKSGVEDEDNPAMAVGNAVYGSPGWGIVHHDSNAIIDNNATYNTFGAGYVAESGNEIGAWTDNIAIFAQGNSWEAPKNGNDIENFDLGQTGDGFWFQGRMVEAFDNVAASVNNGFVYFHRGPSDVTSADSDLFAVPGALYNSDSVALEDFPVLNFHGNEAFASKEGLHVVKANPNQGSDVHSVFEDFTAWSVKTGAHFEYTSHYLIKDFEVIGKSPTAFSDPEIGIGFGPNASDMTIVNPVISGFATGIDLYKVFTPNNPGTPDQHEFTVIDPDISDVTQEYANYDPLLDQILNSDDLPNSEPDIALSAPLTYREGWPDPDARIVTISGTKTDSLGETNFPSGTDNIDVGFSNVIDILETEGYYSTLNGENYFLLDLYFSDRVTGDVYAEKHPVFMDQSVPLGNSDSVYGNAVYNGILDLDGSTDDPTVDAAILWATLTDGQVILSDDAMSDEEDVPHDDMI